MTDWSRLAKLAGMLGSTNDGERLNAARLLDAALKKGGLTFADLMQRISGGSGYAAPTFQPPRTVVVERRVKPNPAFDLASKIMQKAKHRVTLIEARFLNDIIRSCEMTSGDYNLTPKQASWLMVLEKQYITGGMHRMQRTVKPSKPISYDVLDALGLGESPGLYRGPDEPRFKPTYTKPRDAEMREAVMPDARDEYTTQYNTGFAARELDLDD